MRKPCTCISIASAIILQQEAALNHSENVNSSSVTIVPEPCGEPLALPMYASPDGPRCTAVHRCGSCQPLGSLLVGIGWGIGEQYRVDWPDFLAWNLTLAALCCAAVDAQRLPLGRAPQGGVAMDTLRAMLGEFETARAPSSLLLEASQP